MSGPDDGVSQELTSSTLVVTESNTSRAPVDTSRRLRIAFLGNSILYYNDCPRLLEQIIKSDHQEVSVQQDSCLRPNASIASLWTDGNGMRDKFRSPAALLPDGVTFDVGAPTVAALLLSEWDFLIMNDHTQSPVRNESKELTKRALAGHYAPLLGACTVIFLQTAAYREPNINDSSDLGDFYEFESRLQTGYREYVEYLMALGVRNARIAPFGNACRYLYGSNRPLWHKTYGSDGYHPSPHGTWLMACILYSTMFQTCPRSYDAEWWKKCRYFEQPTLPLPSFDEAMELRNVASLTCKILMEEDTNFETL
jgi:hypothetical protein